MRILYAVPLAFSFILPALVAPAAAQQPTQAEMAACMADARKLCAGVEPGGGRILACLSQNKSQISPDCKAVVEKHGG